ncbi:DUF934 domain-containing protein [Biformimicrobium ophioploci]|uniref:DUF934 domain-containing protein n=1 Tax=Biformimicrobium ophioploci TaxID=3036711 RepID=A0ABQ6M1H0_9GAMM|nr:DUF934 domain-containing protein [Microbulbifer sp. NKW57]GMG88141.1 DUF934 domain-containing protein [Microbulbifer sp. NKW57]
MLQAEFAIVGGKVGHFDWVLLDQEGLQASEPARPELLPVQSLESHSHLFDGNSKGVWLDEAIAPAMLEENIQLKNRLLECPVIAIQFNAFTDGRGFSVARMLREQYGYAGQLLATGAFIRDQLSYLVRCGFDAFAPTAEQPPTAELLAEWCGSMQDFTVFYQDAADGAGPLFRQRFKTN